MKPASAELDRRRPVWAALSDLFLDQELAQDDLRYIARVLAASGYSDAELELILRREVGPVVAVNLLSVAGEWAGFDQAWLETEMLKRERGWRRWLPGYSGFRRVRRQWEQVRDLLGPERTA